MREKYGDHPNKVVTMLDDARIKKIEELEIIGTRAASTFYNICEIAATMCGTPYAAVTVLDQQNRWFYSALGIRMASTPRAGTLCERAIQEFEPLVIEDLKTDDPRLKGVNEPLFESWRSYAGAPIVFSPELTIGVLFVADDEPRKFDPKVIHTLQSLAALSVDSFRLQHTMMEQQNAALDAYRQTEALERTNHALEQTRQHVELASHVAKVGFWSKDIAAEKFVVSDSLHEIFDLPPDAPVTEDLVCSAFAGDGRKTFQRQLEMAAETGAAVDLQLQIARRDGDARWIRTTGRVERLNGDAHRIYGCAQDVTELVESKNNISRMAMEDTLTGSYNRRFMPVAYLKKKRLLDAESESLIVMTIDLDNFKAVNDSMGHDVGDSVLVEVTKVLRAELRPEDVLARLGGDEFLILATTTKDLDIARGLAERLRARAAENTLLNSFSRPVTFSIGFTDASAPGVDFPDALKQADLAVYEAKRRGRDLCVSYEPSMGLASNRRDDTLRVIGQALDEDEIEAYYLPKMSLADGAVLGIEALARWRRPDGELLAPSGFRTAFDDPHTSRRLSTRVMERAIRDAGALAEQGLAPGRVAVNICPAQLTDTELPAALTALCEAHKLPVDRLEIELTEQCLHSRTPEVALKTLSELSNMGVQTAFDDFGTAMFSLDDLRRYNIDIIKIDLPYIQGLRSDPEMRKSAEAMILLAKKLDIAVVAEGVEDEETAQQLRELGCDAAQGYHFGRPLPLAELVAFLKERQSA